MIDLTKMDQTKAAATVSSAEALDLPAWSDFQLGICLHCWIPCCPSTCQAEGSSSWPSLCVPKQICPEMRTFCVNVHKWFTNSFKDKEESASWSIMTFHTDLSYWEKVIQYPDFCPLNTCRSCSKTKNQRSLAESIISS
jgi:hypothetical protein